ncbi:MAG: inositol monophosphatase family protein, partial [Rudaea sp.]
MTTLLNTAIDAARAAGAIIRDGFGRAHTVTMKGAINPVTEVDHAAEAAIFQILRAATPGYALLSEESGAIEGREARWIIDPLDGTVNYSHGYPCFGVSIALERAGEVELGVIYNPVLDELFTAERSRGARLNDRPIQVSPVARLGGSIVATGFAYDVWETGGDLSRLAALTRRAQTVRIFGAAVLDLAYIACGRIEAYWDTGLNPWDIAAGRLLVE